MKKTYILTSIVALGLLAMLLATAVTGLAQFASTPKRTNVAQTPPLSSVFIDIWVDEIDNLNPAVAYNSRHNEYLVVWENDRGATRDIYAARVTPDGIVKSTFTIVSNANRWNWLPDVAYSPVQDEYLVVYAYKVSTVDYDIWARRVRWNGSWMSGEIPVNRESGKQWYPAVAYNSHDDEYLVVYENYWSDTLRDIAAQRIKAADGSLLSWRNIASAANTIRRLPDVAYNATRNEYLIAYTYQSNSTANGHIFGKITSANMGDLSSEIQVVYNTYDQDGVALAAGPDEYFAVWQDGPSPSHRTIYGRRLSATGVPHPFVPIADHAGKVCTEVAVAYGPVYGYLINWRYVLTASDNNIYGRYVRAGQNTAAGSEFIIDDTSQIQRSPAVACATTGDCLVVEEDNWPGGGDFEIRGRFVWTWRLYLPYLQR